MQTECQPLAALSTSGSCKGIENRRKERSRGAVDGVICLKKGSQDVGSMVCGMESVIGDEMREGGEKQQGGD